VQRALNIVREGSFIVSVKDPETPSPTGLGLDDSRRAKYPKKLRERFGDRRSIDLDPPDLLDYDGREILLIGASDDVSGELALKLNAEREAEATAEIFRDLGLERPLHPVAPLLKGRSA
jgi:hypothetical protein